MPAPFFNVYQVPTVHDRHGLVEIAARYADGVTTFPAPIARGQNDPAQWTRAVTPTPSILVTMADDVFRFNNEVLGMPVPQSPQVIVGDRLNWSVGAMIEEVREFELASADGRIDEAADGLIDLVYFALGRLQEMGVAPLPVFKEVQAANMKKRRGELSKRPGSLGCDAVKPAGWTAPDHSYLLGLKGEHVEALRALARGEKVLIGHEPVEVKLSPKGTEALLAAFSDEDVLVLNALSPVLREATLLRARKAADYRQGFASLKDYFPFGLKSHAQMIHTKDLRLMNLVSTEREPNHEGIRDTALDLINYATFLVEDIDGVIDGTRGEGGRA
jgi:hypothetical protein